MWNISHVYKCMKLKILHQIPKPSSQVNKSLLKYNGSTCKYICVVSMNAFYSNKNPLYELSQVVCKKTTSFVLFQTVLLLINKKVCGKWLFPLSNDKVKTAQVLEKQWLDLFLIKVASYFRNLSEQRKRIFQTHVFSWFMSSHKDGCEKRYIDAYNSTMTQINWHVTRSLKHYSFSRQKPGWRPPHSRLCS